MYKTIMGGGVICEKPTLNKIYILNILLSEHTLYRIFKI